jgi:hypothetical protein
MNGKMTEVNRLATNATITLTCPACSEETLITETQTPFCRCGQKLDSKQHEAGLLKKREAVMMRSISAREKRAFLTALANIGGMPRYLPLHPPSELPRIPGVSYKEVPGKDNFKDAEWLVQRFKNFFPPDIPKDQEEREEYLLQLLHTRNYLRLAWEASDLSKKLWRIKTLRSFARRLTVHQTVEPQTLQRVLELEGPPKDAIQQSLLYFEDRASLARQCLNPDCRKDRFFFAEKPNQKYCSDPCSEVARSAAKKLWWDMHGSAWRKNRGKNSSKRSK